MAPLKDVRRRFTIDQSGSVAVIFGLVASTLMVTAGMAIDTARYYNASRTIESAMDATAIMIAKRMSENKTSLDDLKAQGRAYFDAQLGALVQDVGVTFSSVVITPQMGDDSAAIRVIADVPLTLMRVAGFAGLTFDRETKVSFEGRRIEVALVLDTTGSMCNPTCAKLSAAQQAAKELIDALYEDNPAPGLVRIGLVPYAEAVNPGGYFPHVTGVGGTGCVVERTNASSMTNDTVAVGGYVRDLAATSATPPPCSISPIVPLSDLSSTTARQLFKNNIDALMISGWTAGHLGAAWGWYMISPSWSGVFSGAAAPRAFSTKDVKAVVLMTDGAFNYAYSGANEFSTLPTDVGSSSYQALELCSAMRSSGIEVYTVAFQAPPDAELMLQACADSTDRHFNADSTAQLISAFKDIAMQLKSLALTK